MSHNIGRIIEIAPIGIGPSHASSELNYLHAQEPGQPTRFVLLHFSGASFPANNRLEVELGYGTDVFRAGAGAEFWTRPINVAAFADGRIPIRYVVNGADSGGVQLVGFGRGHRVGEGAQPCTFTNCDIFLHGSPYTEPQYDTFWICGANAISCAADPKWKNYATLPAGLRREVGRAAGMIVSGHGTHLSTCSATLVGEDLVFSAGHCFSTYSGPSPLDPFAALMASVVFDYQTAADGTRPASYQPKFFKVVEVVEYGYDAGNDFILLRIDISNGNTGIAPLSMRTDLPAFGEEVFVIHHPNGAVKKFSPRDADFLTVSGVSATRIGVDLDVAGGSSGSGLYDTFGNVIGTLSSGYRRDSLGSCSNHPGYFPTARMLSLIGTTPPAPSTERDVMIVLDRSGSMSQATPAGRTKIEEARDAASLFVAMIERGQGHRIGLVSFSNTLQLDHDLLANTATNVEALVGPPPYSGGKVGGLLPGGSTSIGGGLDLAIDQFGGSRSRDEVVLLLTDGMENTPPLIGAIESRIQDRRLCIVGYGSAANLNGPLLASLAIFNDGSYTVAQDELALKKFFASCFGDIFESGFLMDPEFVLPKDVRRAEPVPFTVCGEESVTIVMGWDRFESSLALTVETPAGNTLAFGAPGVEFDRGRTWVFVRINLPVNGEQDGTWLIHVARPAGGEFPPPAIELRYFVNVVAKGGPTLKLLNTGKRFYTGDRYNPLVRLFYPNHISPAHAEIELVVRQPRQSLGNLVREQGLAAPVQLAGDSLSPWHATLARAAEEKGGELVTYEQHTFELFDDAAHEDGAMEPDGIFGNPLTELFTTEGVYTFHAKASFGHDCAAARELIWSVYVDVRVDEGNTEIDSVYRGDDPTGRQNWTLTLTPRDPYGNYLGPGRADTLNLTGVYGTEIGGAVVDHGDGSYGIDVTLDPDLATEPGVVVNQPDRPASVFCRCEKNEAAAAGLPWWYWLLVLLLIVLLILLLIF